MVITRCLVASFMFFPLACTLRPAE
jgi:hypothetical protein